MKKTGLLILCLQLIFLQPLGAETAALTSDTALAQAYRLQHSNLQVEGTGTVIKLLSDDNRGSRHQRFLLRLNSGQTLLVAHNIDLAAKIDNLRVGDSVAFSGEYEWSHKGGTLHWTHHDPAGRHAGGWLKHGDRVYQ